MSDEFGAFLFLALLANGEGALYHARQLLGLRAVACTADGQRDFEKIIVGSKEEYDRILANRQTVTDYSDVE